MSARDKVLDLIQSGFPLEADPYARLGIELGIGRDAAKDAMRELFADGSVRRVGASFASARLGYVSTLCALAAPPDCVGEIAETVNSYAGVTHNYLRENRYNIWFTLITRGEDERARVLASIVERTGCDDLLDLPATRLFKIRVDFGKGRIEQGCSPHSRVRPFDAADPDDVRIVRWGQGNIVLSSDGSLIEHPYAALEDAGISQDMLIARLLELKACGVIRRFGAMVRHRKLGYTCNGMTVWNVEDDEAAACGEAFSRFAFVSHCYERPRARTWPYNIYAMVHAKTADELADRVGQLEAVAPSAAKPLVLVSTRELKKTSMCYFE